MSGGDVNEIGIILGQRGSGKTDYVVGNPSHGLESILEMYVREKDMKVLIVDTFDHPSYRQFAFIPQDMLKRWIKPSIYRIMVNRRFINEFCKYLDSLRTIYNILILFEDAKKHTRLRVSDGMNDLFTNSKQKNIDILLMYHNWMAIPDEMYGMIDFIECFKVKSSPKKREPSMPGYYDIALETWQKVMADPNPYAHLMIETGN